VSLLAVTTFVAFLAQGQVHGADQTLVSNCQAAAGKKAGVAPSAVTVRGKGKSQDGHVLLDLKLADGRRGVCRSQPDGTVDEVKLEEKQP
jgi:hypothetical protein